MTGRRKRRRRRKNQKNRFFVWIISVLVILFAVSGGLYLCAYHNAEKSRQAQPEYQKVSIEQMENTLNTSPEKAKKYIGKKIEVTGIVFMTNKTDHYFVIAKDKNDYLCGIQGTMKDGDLIDKASGLKTGDKITIRGKVVSAAQFLGYEMNVSGLRVETNGKA